ncbi:MAG: GNAT family N-acetyltransferase [Rhodospirillales bacterium]|nr:GNAT family N-acetyltransferase [Rhodospirillales bacterium]
MRPCQAGDVEAIFAIVNDAAQAYKGVIPADRWHEPYMPLDELKAEIAAGVAFSGWEEAGGLKGVMGIQPVQDVHLIRHAYVVTASQGQGIGAALLRHLLARTPGRILVGTWAAASWAVRFYQRHGFALTDTATKTRLLKTYWTVPDRQIETSVVLDYQGGTVP